MTPKKVMVLLIAAALAISSAGVVAAGAPEPVPSGFQGFKAMAIGDVCNLRSEPNTSSETIGQVTQGAQLDVLDFRDNWAKIRHKGMEGWMAGWLMDIDLRAQRVSARITRTDVNLREGPGTHFGVKAMTQKDTSYPAEAKRGEWIRVSLSDGDSAWVKEDLLQLELSGGDPSLPSPVTYEPGDLLVYPSKDTLNVTQSPVKGSIVVARLSRGESARLIDCQGPWIVVETTAGTKGWAYGPEARISSPEDPSVFFSVSEAAWTVGKYPTTTITRTDVNFRSGPGTSFTVIGMLQNGDILRVLESTGEWLKAVSPQGATGWVAAYLTSGTAGGSAPVFSITAEAGRSSRTLTVTGPFENALVVPAQDGKSVLVSTSCFFNSSATLPVNAYEFAGLKVLGSDVSLTFTEKSNYAVTVNTPGRVVLEFTPRVTSVDVRAMGGADVLTIGTLGYALPRVARNGDSITLSVPGAPYEGRQVLYAPALESQLIRSVSVLSENGGTDVTVKVPTATSYLLKKTGNTIEARFGAPGLSGKKIVVDPGHETDDPGAIGPTGLAERNVNWEIATRLVELLKRAGASAFLTRGSLYEATLAPPGWTPSPNEYAGSLAKRAAWSEGADLFISIHNDHSNDRYVSGTTTYICDDTLNIAESKRIAALIQRELSASLGTVDKGTKGSELYVVRESACPAVLVETMFISNPVEETYLRHPATWDKAATGLFRAIERYFIPGT